MHAYDESLKMIEVGAGIGFLLRLAALVKLIAAGGVAGVTVGLCMPIIGSALVCSGVGYFAHKERTTNTVTNAVCSFFSDVSRVFTPSSAPSSTSAPTSVSVLP